MNPKLEILNLWKLIQSLSWKVLIWKLQLKSVQLFGSAVTQLIIQHLWSEFSWTAPARNIIHCKLNVPTIEKIYPKAWASLRLFQATLALRNEL